MLFGGSEKLEKITFPFDLLFAYTTRANIDVITDTLHRLPCFGLLGRRAFLYRAKFTFLGNNGIWDFFGHLGMPRRSTTLSDTKVLENSHI